MGKSDKKRKATEAQVEAVSEAVASTSDTPIAAAKVPSSETVEIGKKKSKKLKTLNAKPEDDIIMKEGEGPEPTQIDALSPIAHPLADKKLGKRVLRTVKKGSKHRFIKRGVKEVVKALRKGEKGLVVMAGDISPMDVLTHIPLLAEENGSGYIFVPSKESLGMASSTKRPTSCVMISTATGGSAAAQKKQAAKKAALMTSDPAKATKLQEEVDEYTTAYQTVLTDVLELNEKISY
ncbi:hypothetical protein CROQUDRAFT_655129 [Cronartium quercuum f. sp. fusiforme G11]|uniref:H/ACA ribonucleoprotein complex subunit 2 n=1 Tax=Cronartium quercuum f. sp. fusiforme G11 TaxID=708437 RepID=A0A9P6NRG6_9BASI|nr:hypothetical protein CROQUDRAFT_655129 [Cronartium quercuum f. sp. fusiforme G11]